MTNSDASSHSARADRAETAWLERQVSADDAGQRLDLFLVAQPEVGQRSLAQRLIRAGAVQVDGRSAKPGHGLKSGQVVRFCPDSGNDQPEEPGSGDLPEPAVLFEDACILVIAKPVGMVAHPPTTTRTTAPSVSAWAERTRPGLPTVAGADRPGIVHRLDRETSGLMVLPKTDEAFHFLKGEFKARRVEKEYRAISYGEARFQSDHIERNITTHPTRGDRMTVTKDGGREAFTYYEVVERFAGFTHFLCRPKTGRTHQIRVHLTSVGHSLVGDRLYRSRNHTQAALPEGAPDPARHCLHARRLSFLHPHTREPLAFEAPMPEDMAALLEWLQANRPA